jgi:sugar-specific transcriptional regulator TrmB
MFAALGLDAAGEEIYRLLAMRVSASVSELATDSGRAPTEVYELLTVLSTAGLATPDASAATTPTATVFTAAPPDIALGAILRQRRDDLRSAEADLLALTELHRGAARDRASGVVEVLTDVDAVRHRFTQIQNLARYEVRSMMVPNLTVVPHRENTAGDAGLRRGVVYRAILQRDALTEPGITGEVLASLASGQLIRMTDRVPVKLVIVDRDVAMVPLLSNRNTAAASILVHPSGLLDALMALFDTEWAHAYPLSTNMVGDSVDETHPDEIDELDARILALVLAGLTEEAAAGQLGVSRRTVQRRIHELMVKAGVDTRIQLGWHASRRGWA